LISIGAAYYRGPTPPGLEPAAVRWLTPKFEARVDVANMLGKLFYGCALNVGHGGSTSTQRSHDNGTCCVDVAQE